MSFPIKPPNFGPMGGPMGPALPMPSMAPRSLPSLPRFEPPAPVRVDFDYGPPMEDLMRSVQRTIVQQDDYRGIGAHGVEDHAPHGKHSQVSIGLEPKTTVYFRKLCGD